MATKMTANALKAVQQLATELVENSGVKSKKTVVTYKMKRTEAVAKAYKSLYGKTKGELKFKGKAKAKAKAKPKTSRGKSKRK